MLGPPVAPETCSRSFTRQQIRDAQTDNVMRHYTLTLMNLKLHGGGTLLAANNRLGYDAGARSDCAFGRVLQRRKFGFLATLEFGVDHSNTKSGHHDARIHVVRSQPLTWVSL